mmetsp:Transcript_13843/g.24334  ORF Transcript_13843/g.24334 Transcript_13843/m.24334 type:complete len:96 (+) Transcript_13843:1027-1314(+)
MTASDETIGDESDIDRWGSSVSSKAPPASPSASKALLAAATTVAGSDGPDLGSTFSAADFTDAAFPTEPSEDPVGDMDCVLPFGDVNKAASFSCR